MTHATLDVARSAEPFIVRCAEISAMAPTLSAEVDAIFLDGDHIEVRQIAERAKSGPRNCGPTLIHRNAFFFPVSQDS